ncbi:MAG: GDP-mannose 4,6-dehydratase [Parcubacteria group bacterium]|nr:GDP-mannose 4,6-dehydratase [Parcubacteria group bacterium]
MKRALITGILGQDGYYLSEHLRSLGYDVYGLARDISKPNDLDVSVHLIEGDLTDTGSLATVLAESAPDELYNLGGQSDVGASFKEPEATFTANYDGFRNLVEEAVRFNPQIRIYQASSSEMFGNAPAPQNEQTPFSPVSPYAQSKVKAYEEIVMPYRANGTYISSGILFNHESPRRSERFVTQKVISSLAKIARGELDCVSLGNIDARRDWGFAGDYVKTMHLMLQQPAPEDFVIATDITHSVRDLIMGACAELGISIAWEGEGVGEVGKDTAGKVIVNIDPQFYRPKEPGLLVGDSAKAQALLHWKPETSFEELVSLMVRAARERIGA